MHIEEFEKAWRKAFAPALTQQQYEDCYVGEYLWHVFSYKLVEAFLEGDAARAAYESADKTGAFAIQLWGGDAARTAPLAEKYKSSGAVEKIPELYVVGRAWDWCYVSTHENGRCGPYFHRAK